MLMCVKDMAHIQNLQVTMPTAQTSGPSNVGMGARRPQMPGGAGLMVAWARHLTRIWLLRCGWLNTEFTMQSAFEFWLTTYLTLNWIAVRCWACKLLHDVIGPENLRPVKLTGTLNKLAPCDTGCQRLLLTASLSHVTQKLGQFKNAAR